MEKFKVGEIVKLKSGGPSMSVKTIYGGGDVGCQWFAGSTLKSGNFDPDTLIKVKDDEPKKSQ